MRLDELLYRTENRADAHEIGAVAVGEGVVGHDPLDAGDALGREVDGCPLNERGAGRALLVGQDLGVHQPGAVVDERVHIVVAAACLADTVACFAPVNTPPATVGNPAELLDVHLDQLAPTLALVADCGLVRDANDVSGHRVALTQIGHVVAAQDARHSPGRNPNPRAQAGRTAPVLRAGGEDLLLDLDAGACGHRVGTRRTRHVPGLALGGVAVDPRPDALA